MNKKNVCMAAAIMLIGLSCGCRFYKINKNVPREYQVDHYSIGQSVKLDDVEVEVKSFKKVQRDKATDGDDNIDCIMDLNIRNASEKPVNIKAIVQDSKLSSGVFCQDYCDAEGDLKKVKQLSPKDEANLTLTYTIFKDALEHSKDKNEFQFYIGKGLYENQIAEKMKNLKLYGKCIDLRGE